MSGETGVESTAMRTTVNRTGGGKETTYICHPLQDIRGSRQWTSQT